MNPSIGRYLPSSMLTSKLKIAPLSSQAPAVDFAGLL